MQIESTDIGVKIITPDFFSDFRGFTAVAFEVPNYKAAGIDFNVRQINQGYSHKSNTVRGLHYQTEPFSQGKLVSCLNGVIYSVAVDIRENSKDFGNYYATELSSENKKVMFVPKGFAHGYLTLVDKVLVQWCVDAEFVPESAKSIRFDDPGIGIEWPCDPKIVMASQKDLNAHKIIDI